MSQQHALRERWRRLAFEYCQDEDIAEVIYAEIASHYGESHRAYHNLSHLDAVFADIDRFQIASPAMEFAVWFHDIIYRPLSGNNEARSALVAVWALRKLGAPVELQHRVAALINCTKRHEGPPDDSEIQLFLDADMAILGAPRPVYCNYVKGVSQEFANVPTLLFKRGRRRFLKTLEASKQVYGSEPFFEAYEACARENIAWELQQL